MAKPRLADGKVREKHSLLFLDGLRGLAAFYVLVGHARWLLWEGYSQGFLKHPHDYNRVETVLVYASSLFRFGHEAVVFFFVLSGFVIHLRYSKQLYMNPEAAQFDWTRYLMRRVRRLYPPLLFSLTLTLSLDLIGANLGFIIYQQKTPYPLINQNIFAPHDWLTGVGNMFFLMNSYVPTWGTNGPLWSLKFEWWFYMIYPAFWWLSKKSISLATGLMSCLWILSWFQLLSPIALLNDVFSMMLAWWVGALLADVFTHRINAPFKYLSPLVGFAILLPIFKSNSVVHDFLCSLVFGGLIAVCLAFQEKGRSLNLLEAMKPLGDMSYSLYVLHFPVLVFMSGWLMASSPDHHLPEHFGWVFVGIIICLLVAFLAHLVVEVPFVKRKVSHLQFGFEAKG